MPLRPRDDSGGHSVRSCFMIGKLSPQPIDVTARNARPAGEIRFRPILGTAVMMDWNIRYRELFSRKHSYRGTAAPPMHLTVQTCGKTRFSFISVEKYN